MNAQLERVLSRLDKVQKLDPKQHKARYMACCPAHDDKKPSLSVSLSQKDNVLLHCWSGCSSHEIVSALGMQMTDLFPPRNERTHHAKGRPAFNAYDAIAVVARDALLVMLAAAKLRNGEQLSEKDMDDLVSASGRCQRIAEEVL